jgi:hypothetical protein
MIWQWIEEWNKDAHNSCLADIVKIQHNRNRLKIKKDGQIIHFN